MIKLIIWDKKGHFKECYAFWQSFERSIHFNSIDNSSIHLKFNASLKVINKTALIYSNTPAF